MKEPNKNEICILSSNSSKTHHSSLFIHLANLKVPTSKILSNTLEGVLDPKYEKPKEEHKRKREKRDKKHSTYTR